jgi:hypothetical protein
MRALWCAPVLPKVLCRTLRILNESTPMEAHQLVNQSSGDVEIYTPDEILNPVRAVLGVIDLDPATSAEANKRVDARQIFTAPSYTLEGEVNGLEVRRYRSRGGLDRPWCGRVWMNPPFILPDSACEAGCAKKRCAKRGWHTATDLPGTPDWIDKFEAEYRSGNITEGLCITFAATSERWFQPLRKRPQCCPAKRTNYLLPDGTVYKGVTKGSAVTYFGRDVWKFARAFEHLGTVTLDEAQVCRMARVAMQLANSLKVADELNSNVDYWGNGHRQRAVAALEAYESLTR